MRPLLTLPMASERGMLAGLHEEQMIKKLWLKNFGPYENASVTFDQFNTLLGVNGAGKSFLFTALKAIGRVAKFPLRYFKPHTNPGGYPTRTGQVGLNEIIHAGDTERTVMLGVEFAGPEFAGKYQVQLRSWSTPGGVIVAEELDVEFQGRRWSAVADEKGNVDGNLNLPSSSRTPRFLSFPALLFRSKAPNESEIGRRVQTALWDKVGIFRFDPTALKTPAEVDETLTPAGYNFATYLDQIRNEPGGKEEFEALLTRFRSLCPHVQDVLLPFQPRPTGRPRKRISLVMTGSGATIPADLESDGTVLLLAYAALLHGSRAHDTICVEEPENGIHPSVIPGLVQSLRELTRNTEGRASAQILMSSHSRQVMDAITSVGPEPIRLVRRGSDGRSTIETVPSQRLASLAGWAGLT